MTAAGSVSTMDRQQSDDLDLVSSLAPALQELDHLLENPTRDLMVSPSEGGGKKKSNKNSGNDNDDDDDDDSLDQELSRLAASEQLLRQELEFAHNFGALLDSGGGLGGGGGGGGGGGDDWMQQKKSSNNNNNNNTTWMGEEHKKDTSQSSTMDSRPDGLVTTTSIEYDSIVPPVKADTSGLPKSPPPLPPATVPSMNGNPPTTSSSSQMDDATAANTTMRVDTQIMEREPTQQQQQLQKDTEEDGVVSAKSSSSPPSSPSLRHAYTLENHSEYLGIQTEARGGWYHLPHVFPTNKNDATALREYIIPLPDKELQRLYVGIVTETQQPEGTATITSSVMDDDNNNNHHAQDETPEANATAAALTIPTTRTTLPLRVVTMRIRPDVLVGAVMEALAASATDCGGDIHKRQGGHLVFSAGGNNNNSNSISQEQQHQHNLLFDCQAVTYKGSGARYCQRTLLIRVYRNHGANNNNNDDDEEGGEGEDGKEEEIELQSSTDDATKAMLPLWEPTPLEESSHGYLVHPANTLLQEAAALVQKMETSKRGGNDGFFSNSYWRAKPVYPSKLALQTAVSQQLLATYKPCPSVQEGRLTLPSLSKSDFPLVKLSWKYIQACWNELEERDLTYASLGVAPFGRFPALLTLDNHYCSQLRRLCRESMIVSLLKAASELEQYARESEYACASLCQALQPTVDTYGLVIPALAPSLPLTAYPLDFVPHAAACPPWGQRVIEALNQVQALDKVDASTLSDERAEQAVRLVLTAFQKQDDEEQSARLGRKNLQVMDRLAKIQTHKRTLIETLHYSYSVSAKAKKAAHELHQYVKKYYKKSNEASSSCPLAEAVCVPLLKSSILVGGATGTVYVTATHLLCVTQLIPIVGGNKIVLESLEGLTFEVVNAEGGGDDNSNNNNNNNNNSSNNNSKTSSSLSLLNPLPTSITLHRRDDDDNGSRGAYKKVYSFRPSYGASRLKTLLEVLQTMQPSNTRITKDGNSQRYVYGDVQEE